MLSLIEHHRLHVPKIMTTIGHHKQLSQIVHRTSYIVHRRCLRLRPRAPRANFPIVHRKLTHRRPIGGSPFGQRIRAVHTHLPPANACALNGAVVRVVPRTWADPVCLRPRAPRASSAIVPRTSYIVHRRRQAPPPPRAPRANFPIVHRTSYIVHRRCLRLRRTSYIGGASASVVNSQTHFPRRLPCFPC